MYIFLIISGYCFRFVHNLKAFYIPFDGRTVYGCALVTCAIIFVTFK